MKKIIIALMMGLLPSMTQAQSYTTMWKHVTEAQQKDLPRTQADWLRRIAEKAEKEHQYGQLLKAELTRAAVSTQVSPDSAQVELSRMEQRARTATDPVLRAVLASVVARLYQQRTDADDTQAAQTWKKVAMAQPDLLARQRSTDYAPAVVSGIDSRIFYDDLLHVIGMETADYATLHDYYASHGNRAAACICAYYDLKQRRKEDHHQARKSTYLQQVDSLISVYGDLREAGELAIEHYNYIAEASDVTAQERYNYINYALSRWGAWPRMNVLRNAQSDLQNPMFNINIGDGMLLPDAERLVRINSIRNVSELTLNIYRLNINGDTRLRPDDREDYAQLQRHIIPGAVQTVTRRYIGQPVWKENSDSIILNKLPIGVYLIEAQTDNATMTPQRALLRVSDLYVIHEELPGRNLRLAVVSATTGKPVPGAHIRLYLRQPYDNSTADIATTLTTTRSGEAEYQYAENRKPTGLYAYTDKDKACDIFDLNSYYWRGQRPTQQHQLSLYTDRTLYRPGQQVHVAAIAYCMDHQALRSQAEAGRQLTFALYDANGKEVTHQEATTDSYGTASTTFSLPTQGLTGRFRISARTDDTSVSEYVSVEQYRRPTFEITFDPYKQSYHPGDTVRMKGWAKTYAGMPVQGGKVEYKVVRRPSLWWGWRGRAQETTLMTRQAVTADDGSFEVCLPMEFPDETDLSQPQLYQLTAQVDVTDGTGESHRGTTSLPLSNRASFLSCDLPAKQLADSLTSLTFWRKNAAGEAMDDILRYRFDGGAWQVAATGKPVRLHQRLPSGLHRLEAICENDTLRAEVILFSYADRHVPTETHDWWYASASTFPAEGKPVYIQVGSSDEEMHVYYSVCTDGRVIDKGVKVLHGEVFTQKLTYKESYGDGITINVAWVRRGKLYTHQLSLQRPLPDERLSLTWQTFRDRLTPGQKEQWTLHVARPDGKPAQGQLLATMYDKSLDQIKPHTWNLGQSYQSYIPFIRWQGGSNATVGLYDFMDYRPLAERSLDFDHWDEMMFEWAQPVLIIGFGRATPMTRSTMSVKERVKMKSRDELAIADNKVYMVAEQMPQALEEEQADAPQEGAPALRENLSETAFFYPALQADAQGNIDLRFTLPESVTTWRFMGVAHDKDMYHGQIEGEAVASKTVMVQPYLPRFLRRGDKTQMTGRLSNTTDHAVSGTATLQMVDPETEAVVCEWSKPFDIKAQGTSEVSFEVDADALADKAKGQSLLIVRMMASGKGYSDGEQHYLPLLPDHERVMTTLPFTQHEAGTQTIDLSQILPQGSTDGKLTLEYTNHPAWLMVQALPTIAQPREENAISLTTAIYANAIGRNLITSSPQIAQAIRLWQQESGAETSLTSALQKNEELKTMVLAETPWVAQAERETDQKQQLASFLDASAIDYRLSHFTEKLRTLQNPDGSFSWWPGMQGSPYMTMAVAKTLTRLKVMTGLSEALGRLTAKAFGYLDKAIADEVAELKREEKKGTRNLTPSELACNYLYASALDHRKPTADMTYLIALIEKMPTRLSLYGKAGSAVILARYGKTQRAREYLQSLNEYAVYKEEMGRYYDTPRAQYSWCDYRIPSQVAAIEALKALTPDDTRTIEDMQRWLLMEKRTTGWDTPLNATDAVYAFLADKEGKADMSRLGTGQHTTFALDGHQLETPQATAALGYIKTALPGNGAHTLSIDKTSQGTSWGAVYAHFDQKSTQVTSQASGISVKRELLTADGQPANTVRRVGEKVRVRITIEADRDYDFVQVQDKRAACLEPVSQLSGYRYGYYCAPHDNETLYYFDMLAKGKHVIETEYYVDRSGTFTSGTCTVQCAYCPEYAGHEGAWPIKTAK